MGTDFEQAQEVQEETQKQEQEQEQEQEPMYSSSRRISHDWEQKQEREQMLKQAIKKLQNFGRRARPVAKFIAVVILIIFLMIPLMLIESQIYSRSRYQDRVTDEIAATAASGQTVIGPVLGIHYRTRIPEKQYFDTEARRTITKPAVINDHIAYLPARNLAIRGTADVERRYRGIYQARLFHLDARTEGAFEVPADIIEVPEGSQFVDASATILFSVSDPRGLDSDPDVLVDGMTTRFKAAPNKIFEKVMGGSRLEIGLGAWTPGQARGITFSFPLKLTGTETLSFAPTAENNSIELSSSWQHPSFGGRFLPRERKIDDKGFTARWEVSQLARNLDNALQGKAEGERGHYTEGKEVMRIWFIDPVNIYLQAERTVKYGSLFIVLSFAAFFIGETLRRKPMHIMQYALTGLALALFFLLLIALSEHLPFAAAYLTGAAACIGLITVYLAGVFRSWRAASGFGAGFAVLYGALYAILQLEDMALLMGSLLLFAALAAVMMSTRRFDWYQLKQSEAADVAEK